MRQSGEEPEAAAALSPHLSSFDCMAAGLRSPASAWMWFRPHVIFRSPLAFPAFGDPYPGSAPSGRLASVLRDAELEESSIRTPPGTHRGEGGGDRGPERATTGHPPASGTFSRSAGCGRTEGRARARRGQRNNSRRPSELRLGAPPRRGPDEVCSPAPRPGEERGRRPPGGQRREGTHLQRTPLAGGRGSSYRSSRRSLRVAGPWPCPPAEGLPGPAARACGRPGGGAGPGSCCTAPGAGASGPGARSWLPRSRLPAGASPGATGTWPPPSSRWGGPGAAAGPPPPNSAPRLPPRVPEGPGGPAARAR